MRLRLRLRVRLGLGLVVAIPLRVVSLAQVFVPKEVIGVGEGLEPAVGSGGLVYIVC